MAPERLERRGTDERADQFSFCVTLWECLFGVRPFAGHTPEELLTSMAIGELQRGSGDDVPEQFERVLRRGLAIEPDARFADMETLLRALVRVPEMIGRRRQVRVAVFGVLVCRVT